MREALLVDDHPNELRGLVEVVEQEGYRFRLAGSLEEARARLAEALPLVLLLDMTLPDGSGLDLLSELHGFRPETVMITGQATVESVVEALRIGARDYLVKPVDVRRLRDILGAVAREFPPGTGNEPGAGLRVPRTRFGRLIGGSGLMQEVFELIERVAPTEAPVLVDGESGTGKELVAETVHELSPRRSGPFLAVNCGAVSPNLIESELFGHERGSFTGALHRHPGYFERAGGGTLFLDEITEMPFELQTKLLRALESGTVLRVGGEEPRPIDVRVIAATNRAPAEAVRTGRLRPDLFYRLNAFPVTLPPLRRRPGDVRLLAHYFLQELNTFAKTRKRFTEATLQRLEAYSWPGNVRELRNAVERAFIVAATDIEPTALPEAMDDPGARRESRRLEIGASIADMERRLILGTLEHFRGDKRRAAQALGVSLKTLYNRLHTYNYALRPCRRG